MLLYVYRMRTGGNRLEGNDEALRRPVRGWLELRPSPRDDYGPRLEAHLREGEGGSALLRPLYWARVRRVSGVMHLAGKEECGRTATKAKSDLQPQSWLCAINPEDALPLLERVRISEWARDIPDIPLDSPLWGPA